MLGAARDGVKAMQEAASGLIGHNGAPHNSADLLPSLTEGANSSPQPSTDEAS
jgi:hypothetical protein